YLWNRLHQRYARRRDYPHSIRYHHLADFGFPRYCTLLTKNIMIISPSVYKKFITALGILATTCSLHPALRAQGLREFTLSDHRNEVSAFVDNQGSTLRLPIPMPLVAFEVNDRPFTAADADGVIGVTYETVPGFSPGTKGVLRFTNISPDTLILANVVPLGRNGKSVYITGRGKHGLSRSHLFLERKSVG